MKLAARMTLDNSGFTGPLSSANAGMGSFLRSATRLIAPLALVAAGILGVSSALGAVTRASSAAATLEDLETSFVTLLGSTEAAGERIEELSDFAASTPFQIEGIAQASRVLETLTRGALSTGDGLRMVGDLAAATGQPFQELSVHVGRLYDGLQSGRAVGESLARLQELGIITGETRGEIEALQKEGAKGDAVWSVAAASFERFSGEMERRSQTWNGLMSTFNDVVDEVFRAFGKPINESLKPFLREGIELAESLSETAKEWGAQAGRAIQITVAAFREGQAGELFGAALMVGATKGGNFLIGMMQSGVDVLGIGIAHVFSPEFFSGLWNGFQGVMSKLDAALLEVFQKPIIALQAGIEKAVQEAMQFVASIPGGSDLMGIDSNFQAESMDAIMARMIDDLSRNGSSLFGVSADELNQRGDALLAQSGQQFSAAFAGMDAAIGDVLNDFQSSDLFDESGASERLNGLISQLQNAIPAAIETAAAGVAQAGGGAVASGLQGGGGFRPEADALSRVGLFIGQGGGPAADHARRTADNTANLVAEFKALSVNLLGTRREIPAWA